MRAIDEEYLSVAEAAERLRVAQSTIRRWIREGDVPAYRLGRRRVGLRRADLDRLVTPVRPAYENQMSRITTDKPRRFTAEERRRGLEIMDELERLRKDDLADRDGKPYPSSTEILAQQREERTRQLIGLE